MGHGEPERDLIIEFMDSSTVHVHKNSERKEVKHNECRTDDDADAG